MKTFRLLLALVVIGAAIESRAQLIAYDNLSGYNAGAMNGQGTDLGYGWTGNWTADSQFTAVPGSDLSYSGLTGATGLIQVSALGYPGAGTSRPFPVVSSGTLYFGAVIQYQNTAGGLIRMFQLSGDGSAGNAGTVFLGQYNSNPYSQNATTQWVDARRGSDGDVASQIGANSGSAITTQNTYLVGRIDFNTSGSLDSVWLWVNPAGASSLQNTATASASLVDGYDLGSMSRFGAYINASSGFYLDEIRISASATDMFGAIPEPSAYAVFAGLVALGFVAYRNRHKVSI